MYAFGGDRSKWIEDNQIKEDIAILYPPASREKAFRRFQRERRNLTVKTIIAGLVMAVISGVSQYSKVGLKEQGDNSSFTILILSVAAGIAVFLGKKQELHKRVEKRNKELLADYPEIVSKLALLTGAGMTLRGAFFKINADYKKKKTDGRGRYAYEELAYMCNEMDTGVAELQAYINWGKRCHVREYVRLSMLLVQNLKKGSHRLIESLREEAAQAFAAKKAEARRAGEEAGTKLLLPMGLMLLIVMVIIIVPAFRAFG